MAKAKRRAAKKTATKKGAVKKAAPVKKKAAAKKAAPRKAAPARRRAAAKKLAGVPAGFHTITPNLVFKDSAAAIEWYGKAFGATEISRMPGPGGQGVMHAELKIGDSILFLNDESPMGGSVAPSGPRSTTAGFQLYVDDADAWIQRAIDAGATVTMPIADMFWGDRMGSIVDPFGHGWMISTRKREMTQQEMAAAAQEFFAKAAPPAADAAPAAPPAAEA